MNASNIICSGRLPERQATTDESEWLGNQTQQDAKENHVIFFVIRLQLFVQIRAIPLYQKLDEKAKEWPGEEAQEQGQRREDIPGEDFGGGHNGISVKCRGRRVGWLVCR